MKENKEGYVGGLGGRIGGSMEEVLGVDPCDKRIQKVLMNFKIIISFKLMFGTSPVVQVLLWVLGA